LDSNPTVLKTLRGELILPLHLDPTARVRSSSSDDQRRWSRGPRRCHSRRHRAPGISAYESTLLPDTYWGTQAKHGWGLTERGGGYAEKRTRRSVMKANSGDVVAQSRPSAASRTSVHTGGLQSLSRIRQTMMVKASTRIFPPAQWRQRS
jgi:hypothetical protein